MRGFKNNSIIIATLFLISCNSLFYFPDHQTYFKPYQVDLLPPEEIYFDTSDHVKLHGWFFKSPNAKPLGTVIQFHGNAQNLTSHFVSLSWLVKEGYDVFTFDYRGYGESFGSPNPGGTYLDGLAALDKAYLLKRTEKNFIVYGQSLGGVIAARALQDFETKKVSLLVLDSTFMSYSEMARKVALKHWFTWILSPLAWLLTSDRYSSRDFISKTDLPLLVIHDHLDPVVPFSCGEEIFNHAHSKNKEFWKLDQGLHVGVFSLKSLENRKRFLNLLSSFSDGNKL
jgi:fermentation-respiration switch protein FrsA (DUF1100 family)